MRVATFDDIAPYPEPSPVIWDAFKRAMVGHEFDAMQLISAWKCFNAGWNWRDERGTLTPIDRSILATHRAMLAERVGGTVAGSVWELACYVIDRMLAP